MKHIVPGLIFEKDPHTVSENPDFSALDALYAGRVAYYGDYHAHSNSGGKSDGKTTPEEWLAAMKELKIDFVGLMDHRQVRHMYLDVFDPEYFIYGTEPAGLWHEPHIECHYLMIFQERGALEKILEKFPDVYQFSGGREGFFAYIRIDYKRFLEVRDAVLAEGGAFVNAHPMQQYHVDDLDYYDFGDGTAFEIIYSSHERPDGFNPATVDNYKKWMELLAAGKRIYNTATSDIHGAPDNKGINAVYSAEKNGPAYVRQLIRGDLNSGYVAIKMALDGNPVGSAVPFGEGMELQVKIEDVHPLRYDPSRDYRVDILTDRGLAYSAPLTLPFAAAIKVQDRKFYRVEVIHDSDGTPAAIGNPIWLKK